MLASAKSVQLFLPPLSLTSYDLLDLFKRVSDGISYDRSLIVDSSKSGSMM